MIKKIACCIIILFSAFQSNSADTTYLVVDKKYNSFENIFIFIDTGHVENFNSQTFCYYENWGISFIDTTGYFGFEKGNHVSRRKRENGMNVSFKISAIIHEDLYQEFLNKKFINQEKSLDSLQTGIAVYKNQLRESYFKEWYIRTYGLSNNCKIVKYSKKIIENIITSNAVIRLSDIKTSLELKYLQKRLMSTVVFLIDENQSDSNCYLVKIIKL